MEESKARLRREIRKRAENLPEEYRQSADTAIYESLLHWQVYRMAKTLFCYVSVGWEVDTRRLLQNAWQSGKRVCVPQCAAGGIMQARQITSFAQLHEASFGLWEPDDTAPLVPPAEIELAIVPCLACDGQGVRLGQGGGYYDRYLPLLLGKSVGLCRKEFVHAGLPCAPHDARVDFVLTEEGFCKAIP